MIIGLHYIEFEFTYVYCLQIVKAVNLRHRIISEIRLVAVVPYHIFTVVTIT
jgi:hypothetical protein